MPDTYRYLEGFNIRQGMTVEGYLLSKIDINENVLSRYKEYSYSIVLTWVKQEKNADYQKFLSTFQSLVANSRVIYTAYGNPYSCNFGELSFRGLEVHSTGTCLRI
jgi:hypothetical protein